MLTPRLYFAYGANISKTSMRHRCPGARPVGDMVLCDWELEFWHHASIRESSGGEVPGVLWELTPQDELSLDQFEGFPYYYKKKTVSQAGRTFFFYVMNQGKSGTPSQSYVNDITVGYHQWGLPTDAIERAIQNVNQRIHTEKQRQF